MIDRKGLWILILLFLAMTAAAVWRLSLLPDWTHMPMVTPQGPRIRSGLVLFVPPLSLLFMIAVLAAQKWLVSGPDEALATWYRRSKLLPMAAGMLLALMEGFIICRSLGHGFGLNPETLARIMMAVAGTLVIMQGNVLPKLPWLSARWRLFRLDPWQSARSRRFSGRITVAFGLAMVIAAVLLPPRATTPILLILTLAFYGAIIWYFVRLKREPSMWP
ncbi:MAG TPA: hypothetical protein VGM26_11760 [Rhizomicrobium sp.]|jgi:hypothetical protein